MADRIQIKILGDGTIKSVTDEIGAENHQSAEGFFETMSRLTGGKTTTEGRGDHVHEHDNNDHHVHQS